jgi:hypothetical protein
MDVDGEDGERGNSGGGGPGKSPAGPPWLARGGGQGLRGFFNRRQRKGDKDAALRADGEMVEQPLPLMRGQRTLHEGADLVRVWMLPGLEIFAHSGSEVRDAAV